MKDQRLPKTSQDIYLTHLFLDETAVFLCFFLFFYVHCAIGILDTHLFGKYKFINQKIRIRLTNTHTLSELQSHIRRSENYTLIN